jgi:hypothetical protein
MCLYKVIEITRAGLALSNLLTLGPWGGFTHWAIWYHDQSLKSKRLSTNNRTGRIGMEHAIGLEKIRWKCGNQ